MTAFTTAQLPIGPRAPATWEELALLVAQVLQAANPADRVVLESGQPSQAVFRWGVGQDADGSQRYQIVLQPKIDVSKIGQSLPDWKTVKENTTTSIGANFSG